LEDLPKGGAGSAIQKTFDFLFIFFEKEFVMPIKSTIKTWMLQIRAPFLLLAVLLVAIGGAVAHHDRIFRLSRFLLCLVGITLAHAAVNLFNELSDFRTGIDRNTRRTPFSGGSGNLPSGATSPRAVRVAAILCITIPAIIGIYLTFAAGWLVAIFAVAGAAAILLYTPVFARWGIGEAAAGICLGSLVVAGTYYAMEGTLTPGVAVLSVPPGILTALLLLLNEYPDMAADREGGRKHLVIRLGYRGASVVYVVSLAISYVILIAGVFAHVFPVPMLIACLTLPLSIMVSRDAFRVGDDFGRLVPLLGRNVMIVLGTDLLMAVGYLI
jgi:1,4-dihydroxy-2-naphthoate octaprenyltransferase